LNVDLHTNDSILTATLLPQLFAGTTSRYDYAFRGSISDAWDVDYYRVKAPVAPAGTSNVMTVMGWGLKLGELEPRVNVYNAAGNLVATQVLVNEAGSFTIQMPNAVSGATYFVRIQDAVDSPSDTGNYFLGVDYGPKADQLYTVANGALDAGKPEDLLNWTISDTRLVHLTLSAKSGQTGARVTLTILDAAGQTVYTGVAKAGPTISTNVLLKAGKYKVRITGSATSGPLAPLSYALAGALLDGPIGPQPNDTTGTPNGGSGSGGGSSWWSGGGSSGQTTQPYGDPYSNV
jgi:hypothetical protein